MIRRITALIIKEFLAILKDPKSRFLIIGPPLIQFVIFGYAATYDLKNIRYAVLDQSRTTVSRALLSRFESSDTFKLVRELRSVSDIDAAITNRDARLVLHLDAQFARQIAAGHPGRVQVILDGRESNVALIALGYVNSIIADFCQTMRGSEMGTAAFQGPELRLDDRAWYNSNLQSRWFITSALGGIISMVVVMLLTSLSVAREREFGTFDQLLVAPFSSFEILVGKAVPGAFFGFADGVLLSFMAVMWFGVPFRGSVAAFLAVLLVFILAMVGVGLFISSLSRTMQQGLLGAFIFMMPAVILSGFTTPLQNMPGWLQEVTRFNPMRYIVIALRQIFLEDAGFSLIWPQIYPLILIACVTLPVAAWFFHHRTA